MPVQLELELELDLNASLSPQVTLKFSLLPPMNGCPWFQYHADSELLFKAIVHNGFWWLN